MEQFITGYAQQKRAKLHSSTMHFTKEKVSDK